MSNSVRAFTRMTGRDESEPRHFTGSVNVKASIRMPATVAALILVGCFASDGWAHHSMTMFDAQKQVVLDGVVKQFQWTNPHIWIQLAVRDRGNQIEYSIEGASPSSLSGARWTRASLKPGDRVQITIHPLRSGAAGGLFVRARFPDGRVLTN